MTEVLNLLLNNIVHPNDILLWLRDPSSDGYADILKNYQECHPVFVPVLLNFLRLQVNSVELCSSFCNTSGGVTCDSRSSTTATMHRNTFPLETVKYVSPCKADADSRRNRIGKSSRVTKLNFATPSREIPDRKIASANTVSETENCLGELLEEVDIDASVPPKHQTLSIKKMNQHDVDGSLVPLSTSTPQTISSAIYIYDNKPANWNRRESQEFSSANKKKSVEFMTGNKGNSSVESGSGMNRDSYGNTQQPNKSFNSEKINTCTPIGKNFYNNDGRKSNEKNRYQSNNGGRKYKKKSFGSEDISNDNNASSKRNEGKNKILSPNVNDMNLFPPMGTPVSQHKPDKKKKRIQPTPISSGKSENTAAKTLVLNENIIDESIPTAFSNATNSNTDSFERERQMLRQFKKKMQNKSSVSDQKDIKSILKVQNDQQQQTPVVNTTVLHNVNDQQQTPVVNTTLLHNVNDQQQTPVGNTTMLRNVKVRGVEDSCSPDHVTDAPTLHNIVTLYAGLVLSNKVPSITMELNFTLQLLTVMEVKTKPNYSQEQDHLHSYFATPHNCVYFASHFLSATRDIIKLLDRSLLKLFIENKRLQLFTPDFHAYLSNLIDSTLSVASPKQLPKSPLKSVPFQIDTDNRSNFPDKLTFDIFKKQRDRFYELLREWERDHHNPEWSISKALGHKIRSLLEEGPDPCNVAHLARLYVGQLLSMCDTASSVSQDEASNSVLLQLRRQHPEKFERLHQRLVVPSRSTTENITPGPSFPGVQHFFRGFLLEAYNPTFYTHLEDLLVARLLQLLGVDDDATTTAARSKTSSAAVLWLRQCATISKFIGVLWFSSYYSPLDLPQTALAQQTSIRNKRQPSIALTKVLLKCANKGELLAGVLCCVQLLCVADPVALHTTHHLTTLCVLIHIYRNILTVVPHQKASKTEENRTQSDKCDDCSYLSKSVSHVSSINSDDSRLEKISSIRQAMSGESFASPTLPPSDPLLECPHTPSDDNNKGKDLRECRPRSLQFPHCQDTIGHCGTDLFNQDYNTSNSDGTHKDFTPVKSAFKEHSGNYGTVKCDYNTDCKSFKPTNYQQGGAHKNQEDSLHFNLQPQAQLFLRFVLSWLFDLPIFPNGLFYGDPLKMDINVKEYLDAINLLSSSFSSGSSCCKTKCELSKGNISSSSDAAKLDMKTPSKNNARLERNNTHVQTINEEPCVFASHVTPAKNRAVYNTPDTPTTPCRAFNTCFTPQSDSKMMGALPTIIFQDTPDRPALDAGRIRPQHHVVPAVTMDSIIVIDYQLLIEWCPQIIALKTILFEHNQRAKVSVPGKSVASNTSIASVPKPQPGRKITTLTTLSKSGRTPSAGNDKSSQSLQKDLQHQLEETFFHTQPKCVRECVEFVADQLISNALRSLHSTIIPAATQVHIKMVQERLQQSLRVLPSSTIEEVEHAARSVIHSVVSLLRTDVRTTSIASLSTQLQGVAQRTVLRSLLPADSSLQAVSVCSSVLQRVCEVRLNNWLDANLNSTISPHLLTPPAAKIIRTVLSKMNLNRNSEYKLSCSFDPKTSSVPGPQAAAPVTQRPSDLPAANESVPCADEDTHDVTAPSPAVLMVQLKEVLLAIERSSRTKAVVLVSPSLPVQYSPAASAKDGVYRERSNLSRAGCVPLCSSHMTSLCEAIIHCVHCRVDIKPSIIKGFMALTVDVLLTACMLQPSVVSDAVVDTFMNLWQTGGVLERPPTLSTTALAPRILCLLESCNVKPNNCFDTYAKVLNNCQKYGLLQAEELQQQCVALFQYSWSQDILDGLSKLMERLKDNQEQTSLGSWLPWVCREMDNLPDDIPC